MKEKIWSDVLVGTRTVTLCGEFVADLTTEECNEWREYITQYSEYHDWSVAFVKLRAVQGGNTLYDIPAVVAQHRTAENKLYQIAKHWYEGIKHRREGSVPVSDD